MPSRIGAPAAWRALNFLCDGRPFGAPEASPAGGEAAVPASADSASGAVCGFLPAGAGVGRAACLSFWIGICESGTPTLVTCPVDAHTLCALSCAFVDLLASGEVRQ